MKIRVKKTSFMIRHTITRRNMLKLHTTKVRAKAERECERKRAESGVLMR